MARQHTCRPDRKLQSRPSQQDAFANARSAALRPFGALKLNGRMTMSERENAVKWFLNNAHDQVLVATTGAAKEGLTLTVANHVIYITGHIDSMIMYNLKTEIIEFRKYKHATFTI
jgi:superfamily II DNA/RNA helicase